MDEYIRTNSIVAKVCMLHDVVSCYDVAKYIVEMFSKLLVSEHNLTVFWRIMNENYTVFDGNMFCGTLDNINLIFTQDSKYNKANPIEPEFLFLLLQPNHKLIQLEFTVCDNYKVEISYRGIMHEITIRCYSWMGVTLHKLIYYAVLEKYPGAIWARVSFTVKEV